MGVTREKLFEEIWAEPMTTVAARYGVSSSFLARICARLRIPRPPRGYWAQLEVGKASPRPTLPAPRPGDELEWSRDGPAPRAPRALPQPPADGEPARRSLPRQPGSRHELIAGAKEHFEAAKVFESGYLRPLKKRLVDMFVTKATLDHALEVGNTLFLRLESRGHRVRHAPPDEPLRRPDVDERSDSRDTQRYSFERWGPDRATVVYVGTVAIGLTLFELSENVEVRYVNGKWVRITDLPPPTARRRRLSSPETVWTHKRDAPTGRLCLRATSPYALTTWEKQWQENNAANLLSKIPAIVRELETDASTIAALVAEAKRKAELERKEREVEHAKWRAEETERRRIQNTKKSGEELLAIVEAWGLAKQIENFFADAEERTAGLVVEERDAMLERLRRSRAFLGGVDALQRFRAWKAPEEM